MIELSVKLTGWWLALTALASLGSALAYALLQYTIAGLSPALRNSLRLALVLSPPLTALLAVLLVSHPWPGLHLLPAHCHGLECGAHTPVYPTHSAMILAAATLSSFLGIALVTVILWAIRRGEGKLRALRALSRPAPAYRVVDIADNLACCVGLWRPQILLSQGLLDRLEPREVEVVIAHEHCHAQRYDNLRSLLLRCATVHWPRPIAGKIREQFKQDAELACDRAALYAVNNRTLVAEVIRKLSAETPGLSGAGKARAQADFRCGDVQSRLQALTETNAPSNRQIHYWTLTCLFFAGLWYLQVFTLSTLSHQGLEWLAQIFSLS